ncbi:MAG: alpha-L-fucosidase [Clostridia bacterium]
MKHKPECEDRLKDDAILVNGVHNYTDPASYVTPQDPAVLQSLETFMDRKLGFMVTWSPGCQMGTYESWALCDADADWSQDEIHWTEDIAEFQQQYVDANQTFNPIKFRPDRWAELAKECGFQYLLFTTKHHDGFCMFDTQTTDYKITAPSCPFSKNKNANITKHLFDAFRKNGMGISVYFSKPDWHNEFYWAKQYGKPADRNVSYSISAYPERWKAFVQYTHAQLRELTSEYGPVDMLWLDGGWVRPDNLHQDISLPQIVEEIRSSTQPGLLVCDRTVGGAYENVLTPETIVPEAILNVPWESCITLGQFFSYHYADRYKTAGELISLLIDIVCKGGNLALNIAPQPDGELPHEGVQALQGLGQWLKANGEAIYRTRAFPQMPATKQMTFTQTTDAFYLLYRYSAPVNKLPRYVTLPLKRLIKAVTLLRTGEQIPFEQNTQTITLFLSQVDLHTSEHADCIKLVYAAEPCFHNAIGGC